MSSNATPEIDFAYRLARNYVEQVVSTIRDQLHVFLNRSVFDPDNLASIVHNLTIWALSASWSPIELHQRVLAKLHEGSQALLQMSTQPDSMNARFLLLPSSFPIKLSIERPALSRDTLRHRHLFSLGVDRKTRQRVLQDIVIDDDTVEDEMVYVEGNHDEDDDDAVVLVTPPSETEAAKQAQIKEQKAKKNEGILDAKCLEYPKAAHQARSKIGRQCTSCRAPLELANIQMKTDKARGTFSVRDSCDACCSFDRFCQNSTVSATITSMVDRVHHNYNHGFHKVCKPTTLPTQRKHDTSATIAPFRAISYAFIHKLFEHAVEHRAFSWSWADEDLQEVSEQAHYARIGQTQELFKQLSCFDTWIGLTNDPFRVFRPSVDRRCMDQVFGRTATYLDADQVNAIVSLDLQFAYGNMQGSLRQEWLKQTFASLNLDNTIYSVKAALSRLSFQDDLPLPRQVAENLRKVISDQARAAAAGRRYEASLSAFEELARALYNPGFCAYVGSPLNAKNTSLDACLQSLGHNHGNVLPTSLPINKLKSAYTFTWNPQGFALYLHSTEEGKKALAEAGLDADWRLIFARAVHNTVKAKALAFAARLLQTEGQ